jgi:hypothetical protein
MNNNYFGQYKKIINEILSPARGKFVYGLH